MPKCNNKLLQNLIYHTSFLKHSWQVNSKTFESSFNFISFWSPPTSFLVAVVFRLQIRQYKRRTRIHIYISIYIYLLFFSFLFLSKRAECCSTRGRHTPTRIFVFLPHRCVFLSGTREDVEREQHHTWLIFLRRTSMHREGTTERGNAF